MKPILFLDVDGVLNAYVMPFREYLFEIPAPRIATTWFTKKPTCDPVEYRVRIHNAYPAWLAELSAVYELTWATSWEDLANDFLNDVLGLEGELSVVRFSRYPMNPVLEKWRMPGEQKWECLVDFAAARPFVFVDDHCAHVAELFPVLDGARQSALPITYGLTREDVNTLLAHAATIER